MAAATKIAKVSSSLSAKFNWTIKNFAKLDSHSYSDAFSLGSNKWQACIFPKGKEEVYDHMSLYLLADPIKYILQSFVPKCWKAKPVDTKFTFDITSQTDPIKHTVRQELTKYKYDYARAPFCIQDGKYDHIGFSKFMPLKELHDPKKGYIVDDTVVIGVEVTCWMDEKDSKSA